MTVLLTGGLGAIGSWALRALVARGERPVVLDVRDDRRLVVDLGDRFALELGDVLDPAVLYRVGYRYQVDRICHLAAVMPPVAQADPAFGFRVNAAGVIAMLELARHLGVKRFVYTSSKAVYGPARGAYGHPTYEPIPEEHPFNPVDVYGATKLSGELMVRQYAAVYGLDAIVLRLAGTYGPGKLERHGAVGLVSQMIESAHAGQPLTVPSGGEGRTDSIYNRDVGRAVVLAAFAERPTYRTYNIGTGEPLSLLDMAEIVRSVAPGAKLEIGGGVGWGDGSARVGMLMATQRAADELGFVAEYRFAEGVRDYFRWLDEHSGG